MKLMAKRQAEAAQDQFDRAFLDRFMFTE